LGTLVGLAWLAGREPGTLEVLWSPYQKLTLLAVAPDSGMPGVYKVNVNNVGFQAILDLRPQRIAADPQHFPPAFHDLGQYDIPFLLHPDPKRVLIVGAGSGNDVAGALRHGASEVVAVEIDPAVLELGKRLHPEKPYDAPAVRIVNDDARSFFTTCQERFDVICFGLLDAHTGTTMTNARLDHFVYTRESLERARSLLRDSGVLVLTFAAEKDYIADRLANVLADVFAHKPLVFWYPQGTGYGMGGGFFVTGDMPTIKRPLDGNPRLAQLIEVGEQNLPISLTGTTPVSTDDWPYLYLQTRSIPLLFYLLAGMLLILFFVSSWNLNLPLPSRSWTRSDWHFFLMGAAFLLLEVQNISKASVVLGNTWLVNAVIISGILAFVLLANWLAPLFPSVPAAASYACLGLACLALYFVDLSRFAILPYATKALVVGGLTSLPMLFSGLVFIRSFQIAPRKDAALGANLFGALVGGLLQSITFITGMRALLLLVLGFYAAAFFFRPTHASLEPSSAAANTASIHVR